MRDMIIFCVFLLVMAPLALIASYNARKRRGKFTYLRELLDDGNISMLKRELERDASERPRSISAMTSLYLPKIAADFPDFNYPEMKARVETALVTYLRAIDEGNAKKFSDGTAELTEYLSSYIGMLKDDGIIENYDMIKVHRSEISKYFKDRARCIITFQLAIECYHSKERNGEILEGSKDRKYQTKYEVDMVYIQDRDLVESDSDRAMGYNCPNCGAPIKSLEHKVCEYCGCGIQEFNIKVWNFNAIREIARKGINFRRRTGSLYESRRGWLHCTRRSTSHMRRRR